MLLQLSKEDLELAYEEVNALSKNKLENQFYKNLTISDCNYERLTYLQSAFKILDEFPLCKSFKFEKINIDKEEMFKYVDELKSKGAKVSLDNPEKIFSIVNFNNRLLKCELIHSNKKEFRKRNPKSRPGFHPGACKPDFAKVLVNLSGVKQSNEILDPFCGTGGILIEAQFMNIKAFGSDIDFEMLEKAKTNLEHYKLETNLEQKDALNIDKKVDAIVTEIPFGTTTRIHGLNAKDLVKKFIENINEKNLTQKIVIGLPNKIKFEFPKFEVKLEHEVYIHKSLSKIIVVLEKTKQI